MKVPRSLGSPNREDAVDLRFWFRPWRFAVSGRLVPVRLMRMRRGGGVTENGGNSSILAERTGLQAAPPDT